MIRATGRDQPTSTNCFEIDLDAIAQNTAEVRRLAGSDVRIFAAVKANGYGFGLSEVVDVALASGADGIALVEVSAAVNLRKRGIDRPILLYAGSLANVSVIGAVDDFGLMPTLANWDDAVAYSSLATRSIKAFIKIDVGLERHGIYPESGVDFVKAVRRLPNVSVEGIYTHLHVPDGEHGDYVGWQYQRFLDVLRGLQAEGIDVPLQMAASSSTIRTTPDMMLNAIDPGHLLYGLAPSAREKIGMRLKPAFVSLTTRLTYARPFQRTEFVEHLPFEASGVTRIGVIPFGQAHGMADLNCGHVLVSNRHVRLLGGPHAEHSRVDLSEVSDANIGDEVVIIGRQGDAEISLQDVMTYRQMNREMDIPLKIRDSVRRVYRR